VDQLSSQAPAECSGHSVHVGTIAESASTMPTVLSGTLPAACCPLVQGGQGH
jgi:hypothetical protein